jgi:K+-sensing histidine kinase KdpD
VLYAVIAIISIVLLVARDVSARRRQRKLADELETLRSQAKQSDRLVNVGQLVSGLAQDLKSPLQGMLGSAEILEASGSSDVHAAQVKEIRDNVRRAVGIVRNMLAFTETTELDRRWYDLNEIVRLALQQHRSGGDGGAGVAFQGTSRLQLVYVDGRRLEKVLTTLLAHTTRAGASCRRTADRSRWSARRRAGYASIWSCPSPSSWRHRRHEQRYRFHQRQPR